MRKRLFLGITTLVLMAIAGMTAHALSNKRPANVSAAGSAASSPTQNNTLPTSKNQTTDQPITVTGAIECLTPKNASGQQVTSCALGLTQTDGKSYALNSPNPTTIGSLPTGQKVQVSGTLSQQSSQYTIEGIINVTSVRRL